MRGESAAVREEATLCLWVTGAQAIARVPKTPGEAGQGRISSFPKAGVKGNLLRVILALPLQRDTFWLAVRAHLRKFGGHSNGHRTFGPPCTRA